MPLTGLWTTRATWLLLPVVAGPTLSAAFDGRSRAVQLVASCALWTVWAGVLVASMVPRTVSLTAVRVAAPATLLVIAWAALQGDVTASDVLALVAATIAAVSTFDPTTGDAFVNGSSYGDERRMPLRVPGALLLGPLALAWAAAVCGVIVGPLLLAARQWVTGAVAVAVGLPLALIAVRALHGLARRWLVFVPAGVVVHDPMSLVDPILLPRRMVRSIAAAPATTDALDLTQRSLGLALELVATEPIELMLLRPGRREGKLTTAERLLITPTRPGAVLAEAARRRLPTG